jgi:biofilm PGA synthesis N-glycosyltransferase PgaC
MQNTYVLVTAARNEEGYIEKTIESVISQTILPKRWAIVSDGSTDRTDEIVRRYEQDYKFIRLVRLQANCERDSAAQVHAQLAGVRLLRRLKYEFVGMLDADISLEPDYYEKILSEFRLNPELGIAGGSIFEKYEDSSRKSFASVNSVPGGIQMFRRQCYEQIGGYVPGRGGGMDAVAEVMARMHGWQVRSFPQIKVVHERPTGTAARSVYRARFLGGVEEYQLGYHPLFHMAKSLHRICQKPYLAGCLLRMCGYWWSWCRRDEKKVGPEFVRFLRREQMQRIWARARIDRCA